MNQAEGIAYSGAAAINDRDQIVGSGNGSALLWQNGKVHWLMDRVSLPQTSILANATAINQSGMIVANTGDDEEGEVFLLVPNELLVDANNDGKMSFTNAGCITKTRPRGMLRISFGSMTIVMKDIPTCRSRVFSTGRKM